MDERPRLTPLTVDQISSRRIPSGLARPSAEPLSPELRDKAARIVALEEAVRERDASLLEQLRASTLDPNSKYPEDYDAWLASEEADEFAATLEQVLGPRAVAALDL